MPVIWLTVRKGLTREQKRTIVQQFTGTVTSIAGVPHDAVTVLIDEKDPEDIGKSGKLRCDG